MKMESEEGFIGIAKEADLVTPKLPPKEFVGKKLVDSEGEAIGTISRFWDDKHGNPAFFGVKTHWWPGGALHAVPVGETYYKADSNDIWAAFTKERIEESPVFAAKEPGGSKMQRDIFDFYNSQGGKFSQPAQEEPEATVTEWKIDGFQ